MVSITKRKGRGFNNPFFFGTRELGGISIMKFKTITTKVIKLNELSQAVLDEIWPKGEPLFWVKVPKSIKEVENNPEWNNVCKEADFSPGEYILIEK